MVDADINDPEGTSLAADVIRAGEPMSEQQIDACRLCFAAGGIRLRPAVEDGDDGEARPFAA